MSARAGDLDTPLSSDEEQLFTACAGAGVRDGTSRHVASAATRAVHDRWAGGAAPTRVNYMRSDQTLIMEQGRVDVVSQGARRRAGLAGAGVATSVTGGGGRWGSAAALHGGRSSAVCGAAARDRGLSLRAADSDSEGEEGGAAGEGDGGLVYIAPGGVSDNMDEGDGDAEAAADAADFAAGVFGAANDNDAAVPFDIARTGYSPVRVIVYISIKLMAHVGHVGRK